MTTTEAVPADLVVDFDVYDPALAAPVDVFNQRIVEVAGVGPLVYSPLYGGHWIVTRYQEITEVLRDPARFSSYPNNLIPHGFGKFIPLEYDPPTHTVYRRALQPLFNPHRMNAMEPQVRAIVTELIDGFAARGSAEFISEFAHELPARVFLALMGWPLADAPMFTEATDTTLHGIPGASEEESIAARAEAAGRMMAYFAAIVADRRNGSADASDVTASIINSDIVIDGQPRPLTDDELCNIFMLLLIAGLHTTQGSLAWGLMHLGAHREQRDALVGDPSLIPAAVEEVLRMEAAVSAGRSVVHDTELGGVHLRAGDQLLVVLAGANRDEREFDHPDDLQVTRSPNRHMSFGAGPHRCLGSHLARVMLRIAFEELFRRLPDIEPDPDRPSVSNTAQVRGVLELHIRFTPEGPAA
ncbi:cytochrome [Mycobacterium florentinum]|uniref:Cytochrome n=1 Tax=Mycobacterium florentinum TaxID=292462 RepID=A0A1X1UCF5_MYCFL|nr:cytochrome P450 [Mycobacterium florentinum]MCV7412502.1 cytochrome P450 [Mycobacterium florentinum]ORV54481.1 cytochrome [Mycobacterium florentinum]BBX81885.1 cytochrome P450 [Mycobacterium florentinum]